MRDRVQSLAPEVARFAVVGAVGLLVDVGVFNALRYSDAAGLLEDEPLSAKAISVAVATLCTYFGNRRWTWRHRTASDTRRELGLFVVFNAIGMGVALACLGLSHYVLDLRSALADNISANMVGLGLGMVFRFWSYRTFVFRPVERARPPEPAAARVLATAAPRAGSARPT